MSVSPVLLFTCGVFVLNFIRLLTCLSASVMGCNISDLFVGKCDNA